MFIDPFLGFLSQLFAEAKEAGFEPATNRLIGGVWTPPNPIPGVETT
jgi:hypothetical protein